MDADRGPELADLSPQPFPTSARAGSVSRWNPHLSFFADRRRGGGPQRTTADSSRLTIRAARKFGTAGDPGCHRRGPDLAHSFPLLRLRSRPAVWRSV